MRPLGLQTHVVHREEHAPMHGLEAVADVRKRTADDDAHRVVEVARAHLVLELTQFNASVAIERRHLTPFCPTPGHHGLYTSR